MICNAKCRIGENSGSTGGDQLVASWQRDVYRDQGRPLTRLGGEASSTKHRSNLPECGYFVNHLDPIPLSQPVHCVQQVVKPCVGIDTHRGRCATSAPRGRERVLPTDRPGLGFPTPVPASIPTIGQRRAASQARRLCFLQVLRVLPCCMTDFQGTQARSVGEESRVKGSFGYGICKNKAHVIANLDGQWEHSGRLVMGRSTLMTYSHGCIGRQARIWQAPNGACTGVLENCKW